MAEVDFRLPQDLPLRASDGQPGIGNHMNRLTRLGLRTEARPGALAPHVT